MYGRFWICVICPGRRYASYTDGRCSKEAYKAVRTVISSVSLMTPLTSDHLKCHCSAVAISSQFLETDYHFVGLHETTYHQCVKRAVNPAQWVLHDLIFTLI
jgi:hypothetical protein